MLCFHVQVKRFGEGGENVSACLARISELFVAFTQMGTQKTDHFHTKTREKSSNLEKNLQEMEERRGKMFGKKKNQEKRHTHKKRVGTDLVMTIKNE